MSTTSKYFDVKEFAYDKHRKSEREQVLDALHTIDTAVAECEAVLHNENEKLQGLLQQHKQHARHLELLDSLADKTKTIQSLECKVRHIEKKQKRHATSQQLRWEIYEQQKGLCADPFNACPLTDRIIHGDIFEIDHIHELADGGIDEGSTSTTNKQLLCVHCHAMKTKHHARQRRLRLGFGTE